MKKRVLLATWYKNYNYGTALQAYALKKVIEEPASTGLCDRNWKQGTIVCEFLPHTPIREKNQKGKWKKIFSIAFFKMKLQQYKDKEHYVKKARLFELREKAFQKFIEEQF